jgi:hypothetical protein
MIQFEDKLHASAQRLVRQENRNLHVPQNPMQLKRTYWGWVATPAAAVVGIIFGMSLPLFMRSDPTGQLAQTTDTVRILQSVRDTLYLTQIVEKERVVYRSLPEPQVAETETNDSDYKPGQCTSIQCDGIDYSILATN